MAGDYRSCGLFIIAGVVYSLSQVYDHIGVVYSLSQVWSIDYGHRHKGGVVYSLSQVWSMAIIYGVVYSLSQVWSMDGSGGSAVARRRRVARSHGAPRAGGLWRRLPRHRHHRSHLLPPVHRTTKVESLLCLKSPIV